MKKIYLSLLSVLAGMALQAQLTQTNHAPANGETWSMNQVDSTNINPGASGAGANWSFSTATRTTIVLNYAASTNTNSAFPSASVAVSSSSANTSYFTSSATDLKYFGGNFSSSSGGTVIKASLNYSAPAVAAVYPMNLSSTSSATTSGSITVTQPIPTSGTFNGTSNVILDGTGTLTLPGGLTYTNVSRVMTTQIVNFTTSLANGTLTQLTYDYYSAGTKAPMFTISNATANVSGFGTATQTVVYKNKSAVVTPTTTVSLDENNISNVLVFPNPSSSVFNVVAENLNGKVMIYDITGKLITTQSLVDGKARVDVSQYNTGLYIYKISDVNNRAIKAGKLTVSH